MVNNIIQEFYCPMHGDSNWKYVIDVAPRVARVLQATQDLTSMDEVNRIVDAVKITRVALLQTRKSIIVLHRRMDLQQEILALKVG